MLVHNVYFSLHDASATARAKLLAACHTYLTKHPGVTYFACGILAEELRRDVNDRNFDVALHLIFETQAAHDAYQTAPRHLQFIKENKDNWKQVRVFDSIAQQ